MNKNERSFPKLTAKQLAFCAMSVALAFILGKFSGDWIAYLWPAGGEVTLFSMLVAVLPAFWFGPVVGLMASLAYGLLRLVFASHIYFFWQGILDYLLAFGILGVAGFFRKRKHGLVIGYSVAVLARFLFTTLSSLLFWTEFLPGDTIANLTAVWASVVYNLSYIGPEYIVTVIVLSIPSVKSAIRRVGNLAKE